MEGANTSNKGGRKMITEWKLEDHIKNKNDLVYYMDAVVDEYKASFLPQNNDNPDKAFEYFIIACKECVNIAKRKLWVE